MADSTRSRVVVGVLALQGAFSEHAQLLRKAFVLHGDASVNWACAEVRTPQQLDTCDALIIPGGESTTIALVAARSGLLEPLRDFVKVDRKPVWGTCAGMILLSEAANRTKTGGQDLIGGLDVRVNRNYFGRQVESFEADLDLPFLTDDSSSTATGGAADVRKFRGVFIRAPVVEKLLPEADGVQDVEQQVPETVVAPSRAPTNSSAVSSAEVEILATLLDRQSRGGLGSELVRSTEGDIIAVRQRNVFATAFHPELTNDPRIHSWWLSQVRNALDVRRG